MRACFLFDLPCLKYGCQHSSLHVNYVIIYSPSSCCKPVWVSFFCWTQRKVFWRTIRTK